MYSCSSALNFFKGNETASEISSRTLFPVFVSYKEKNSLLHNYMSGCIRRLLKVIHSYDSETFKYTLSLLVLLQTSANSYVKEKFNASIYIISLTEVGESVISY